MHALANRSNADGDEDEVIGFKDAVSSLQICMQNGLFANTRAAEPEPQFGLSLERAESMFSGDFTKSATIQPVAAAAAKDTAPDSSRSVLHWLRSMSKGPCHRRLWRPLVESMERLDCKLSQEDAAFWLYRSVVTYTPVYERVHAWNSVQLKENFHRIAPKLDERFGLLKQLGLTGEGFLNLSASDLTGYPLSLTPMEQREVQKILDRISDDNGAVKGTPQLCEDQFVHLQADTLPGWYPGGPPPNPQAPAVRSVLRHLTQAMDLLPPVSPTDMVFKTAKVRGTEADISRRNEENFAPGTVLSWPFITSGTRDVDVLTYLHHYQANAHRDYLSRGINFTVVLLPLAPQAPSDTARDGFRVISGEEVMTESTVGDGGSMQSGLRKHSQSGGMQPEALDEDDAEGNGADPLLVDSWNLGSLRMLRVDTDMGSLARSEKSAADLTAHRRSSAFQSQRRATPPITVVDNACELESVFTSEDIWDPNAELTAMPSAMRDATYRHSTNPELDHPVCEVLIPPDVEFQVQLNCYLPLANSVLVVAEELDALPHAMPDQLLDPVYIPLGSLERAVTTHLDRVGLLHSPRRTSVATLRRGFDMVTALHVASPKRRRQAPQQRRQSVPLLANLRELRDGCRALLGHTASIVKNEAMCHEITVAMLARMHHRQTVMHWMESWHSFLGAFYLLEAREGLARTELNQDYRNFREMAFALKDMVAARRVSEAKACWVIQKLEDPDHLDLAATIIGIISYQKQKASVLANSQLKGVPHHQIMKKRHHSAMVLNILTLVLNSLRSAGRHSEFIQQFSMPDATQICQIHVENQDVALVYLDIWNELGTSSEAASMMYTHELLEQLLRAHSTTEVTMKVLSAIMKVSKKLKGALAVQQPNLASWVVRRALEHVDKRLLLRKAIGIIANIAVTPSSLTKDFIYGQGAGKLCLTVMEAVGWADVTLLRQSLEAFVRMLSSLDVSWQAKTTDRGQAVINAVVAEGNELWPEVMASDAVDAKSEWQKARSLALRAQSLLYRVKSA